VSGSSQRTLCSSSSCCSHSAGNTTSSTGGRQSSGCTQLQCPTWTAGTAHILRCRRVLWERHCLWTRG
ncbi:hypothetical protein KUCAC02_032703, partial [Chaenocephalus aceratus]